ncbi:poxin-like isoform X2 [Galleria mellonella]|uniref:Poxin-like isoform X2 n=1 Tax=Galleria mellonella TaxID=7137 RepID=A0ABM3MC03_GALME|nr:poxin-like isoform X2 [Galleria mellonella]
MDSNINLKSNDENEQVTMSKRTVLNENYKGIVENFPIPAELHERPDGTKYASFGDVVPIHCCTPEQVSKLAKVTHHYCDVFTQELMAPLEELAYVRLDENTAEKVFINRTKRLLITSSDGQLAQWRCAPSFESANQYVAGAPVVNQDGALLSVVTARKGNHYAVSTFEGEGGYFETPEPWRTVQLSDGQIAYGAETFNSREELTEYISKTPPASVGPSEPPTAILVQGKTPRLALVAKNGRQIAHHYLPPGLVTEVDYL